MWRPVVVFAFAILLAGASGAGAAAPEVPGTGPVDAVTVFPDRARVTRAIEAELPAGESSIVVSGLPIGLIGDSVRVEPDGGAVVILSVETRKRFAEEAVHEEERRLRAEIEELGDRTRALDDRIAALKMRLQFITAIGRDLPAAANEEIVRGKIDPKAWQEAWTLIGSGAAAVLAEIREAEFDKREIAATAQLKRNELGQIGTGQTATVEVRINVDAPAPETARIRLHYQIGGSAWRPLYDARLDTASEEVVLTQIAEVGQRTGEDWSGVTLTLSTASPAQGGQMPHLESWFVDVGVPVDVGLLSRLEEQLSAASEAPAPTMPAEDTTGYSQTRFAQMVASEFAAEYRIRGRVDVPSDGAPHKFPISEREIEGVLAVQAVPRLAPQAYLFSTIVYRGAEPLLAGPVSLFRDGAFIGTGAMNALRPGEVTRLSFGIDDRVRIAYRLEDGERSSEGLINPDARIERRYVIEVANHHERAIAITVLDQLPVPLDERIDVVRLSDTTPPTEKDVDGRKGVLAWTYDYEAGEERTITFGYALSHPEDVPVPGF